MNRMVGGTLGVAVIGAVFAGARPRPGSRDPAAFVARVHLGDVGRDRGRRARRGDRDRGCCAASAERAAEPASEAAATAPGELAAGELTASGAPSAFPPDAQPPSELERRPASSGSARSSRGSASTRPRRARAIVSRLERSIALGVARPRGEDDGARPRARRARTASSVSRVWLIVPRPGRAAITTGRPRSTGEVADQVAERRAGRASRRPPRRRAASAPARRAARAPRAAVPGRSPRRPARRRGAARPAGRSGRARSRRRSAASRRRGAAARGRARRRLVEAADGGLEDGHALAARPQRRGDRRRDDRLADLGAGAGDEEPARSALGAAQLARARGGRRSRSGERRASRRARLADHRARRARSSSARGGSPSPSAAAASVPSGTVGGRIAWANTPPSSARSQSAIARPASPTISGTIWVREPPAAEALRRRAPRAASRRCGAAARPCPGRSRAASSAASAAPTDGRRRRGREDERPRGVDQQLDQLARARRRRRRSCRAPCRACRRPRRPRR